MMNRSLQRALVLSTFILASASASAVSFDGSPVTNCSLANFSYTCASGALSSADSITVAASYIVNLSGNVSLASLALGVGSGLNGAVSTSGAVVLAANAYVFGNVAAGTSATLGAAAAVTGNLSSGSTVDLGLAAFIKGNLSAGTTAALGAQAYVTGTLSSGASSTLGANAYVTGGVLAYTTIDLGANAYVVGDLTSTTATVTMGLSSSVTGSVTAGTTLTMAANSFVTGSVVAGTTVTLAANAYISGSVQAGTTTTIAAGGYIGQDLNAGTTATLAAGAYVGGNLNTVTATLGAGAHVGGNLNATTATADADVILQRDLTATTATLGANSCYTGTITVTTLTLGAGAGKCVGASGPDHILISHSGSSITCAPQTVTITACADAACTSLYTGGAAVTLMPGGGLFTIGATGVNTAATVQQTTPGTINLAAISAAVAASSCYNTSNQSSSCAMTVAAAGFLLSVPNHVSNTTQPVTVSAVKQADNTLACVPAFSSVLKTLNFRCDYNNPASGTLPLRLGAEVPLAASANASCAAGGVNLPLSFNALGVAVTSLAYADVGQLTLSAKLVPIIAADTGLVMAGSSSFIVAPASFAFSQIQQTAAPQMANPAPADVTGVAFIKAGAPFSATITAFNASGVTTPNFGNEAIPETVSLSNPILIAPLGGANPSLTGSAGAFANGVASASKLAWNEVGIIALYAKLANPYGYLGQNGASNPFFPSGTSVNVGRFIPAYFNSAITSGVPMTCLTTLLCPAPLNAFVYSKQPFGVTVSAFNLSGGITSNYSTVSGFSKTVSMTAWSDPTSAALQNPPASSPGSTLSNNSVLLFTQGVGTNLNLAYAFPSSAVYPAKTNLAAPTMFYLRAVDTDGVASQTGTDAIQAGLTVVGGRMQVSNAYGSELLPVTASVTAQYWDGSYYRINTSDQASGFLPTNVQLSNCTKSKVSTQCASFIDTSALVALTTLVNGSGRFRLAAAGAGSVDLSLAAPAYLPSTIGRIVYGLFKSPLVFVREMY